MTLAETGNLPDAYDNFMRRTVSELSEFSAEHTTKMAGIANNHKRNLGSSAIADVPDIFNETTDNLMAHTHPVYMGAIAAIHRHSSEARRVLGERDHGIYHNLAIQAEKTSVWDAINQTNLIKKMDNPNDHASLNMILCALDSKLQHETLRTANIIHPIAALNEQIPLWAGRKVVEDVISCGMDRLTYISASDAVRTRYARRIFGANSEIGGSSSTSASNAIHAALDGYLLQGAEKSKSRGVDYAMKEYGKFATEPAQPPILKIISKSPEKTANRTFHFVQGVLGTLLH